MKNIFAIGLMLTSLSLLFSFDFGVELTNGAGISYIEKIDWNTEHKATLWLTKTLDSLGDNTLSIEGSFYGSKPGSDKDFRFFLDLDLLQLSLTPINSEKMNLSLDAGRFSTSDITGMILNQTIDGLELHFILPYANFDLTAGYTGFLNVRKGLALMSIDDTKNSETDKIFAQGSSRALAKATLQFPQLIGPMDLIIEGLGQYDARRILESDYTELLDTAYGTINLNSPLTNSIFLNISATYQNGILEIKDGAQKYSNQSFLVSTRLDFYPTKKSMAYAQFDLNPANSDIFTGLKPITFIPSGNINTSGLANKMRAQLGLFVNPIKTLSLDASGKTFFNTPGEDVENIYLGSEVNFGASYGLFSDLKMRLDSSLFMPNKEKIQYKASLKIIFAL